MWRIDLLGRFRLASLRRDGRGARRHMGMPHGLGTGSTGQRDSDLFRELQVVGSEQRFVPLRRHGKSADARDFRFDLCIDETQQRIDLIRIEHRCFRSPMIAAFVPLVRLCGTAASSHEDVLLTLIAAYVSAQATASNQGHGVAVCARVLGV